jgi:hypothetical protein
LSSGCDNVDVKYLKKDGPLLKELQGLENCRRRSLDKSDGLFPVDKIHWIASPGLHVGIDPDDGALIYLVRISYVCHGPHDYSVFDPSVLFSPFESMSDFERAETHKALATLMNWSCAVNHINNNSVSSRCFSCTSKVPIFNILTCKGSKCLYAKRYHEITWWS